MKVYLFYTSILYNNPLITAQILDQISTDLVDLFCALGGCGGLERSDFE